MEGNARQGAEAASQALPLTSDTIRLLENARCWAAPCGVLVCYRTCIFQTIASCFKIDAAAETSIQLDLQLLHLLLGRAELLLQFFDLLFQLF